MSISSWETDPTGRHQYRWYDGERWTDQVADNGIQAVDPVSIAEARLPFKAPEPDYSLPTPPTPAQPASESSAPEPSSPEPAPPQTTNPVPVSPESISWVLPPNEARPQVLGRYRNPQVTKVSVLMASLHRRFWGLMLELLLIGLTAGIGWLIWSFFVYSRGQTPAKQVLKMRVVVLGDSPSEHKLAGWWTMFLRELVLKWLVSSLLILPGIWFIINAVVLSRDEQAQALWDRAATTWVVHFPNWLLSPKTLASDPMYRPK